MNWRRYFDREAADREQREELELYVDLTAREYSARGMSPEDALAAARRKLGNTTRIREEVYGMNTLGWLESAWRDARLAARMIRTRPGFSVPALLSLALGIGANIAIFSVVNAVLIRPLPYPRSEALAGVYNSAVFQGQPVRDMPLSLEMFEACAKLTRSFQRFGVWIPGAATVTGIGEPEQVPTVAMTHDVLPTLAVAPYLGRWFERGDDAPGAPATVMLSYGYWQRRFGGDAQVVGRMLLIDFVPRRIVGVMPRGFQFLDLAPDVLLPQPLHGPGIPTDEFSYSGIARLKPGVTIRQANQDMARALAIWSDREGIRQAAAQLQFKPDLRPLKQDVVGDAGAVLGILMGALALVLLLVCANVANLVQVRAQARRQEFAIRAALGAGWGRIARELLVESMTLGLFGGALGLGLAYFALRILITSGAAGLPRAGDISLDGTGMGFALACSLGSGLLFGSIALIGARGGGAMNVRGASQARQQVRARNTLVVAQVSLALVLLIAAGLMVRSFVALRAVRPGFTHPEHIQTLRLLIPEAQIPEPRQVTRMQAEIVARLSAIPGVTAAGYASGLPLEPEYHNGNVIGVEGRTPPGRIPPNRTTKQISPGLLAAQGTRILAGRDFDWNDVFGEQRVAIVSENMARENWGEPRNAPGKRIRMGQDGPWIVVVGVAENVYEDGVQHAAPPVVYLRAGSRRGVTLAVRSERAGTRSFLREIAAAIHAVNPNLPLAKVRTLNEVYRHSMARTSFALVLLGVAAAMSLTLSLIGVYGVLAYAVAQRSREVGIRVALGAGPAAVRSLFVRQGMLLAGAGGILGILAAAGLSRWISSLLFGVAPLDPLTYSAAGATILTAALAASYIPARRAASLDPMTTLRSE